MKKINKICKNLKKIKKKTESMNSFVVHYHLGPVMFKIILIIKKREHHKKNNFFFFEKKEHDETRIKVKYYY